MKNTLIKIVKVTAWILAILLFLLLSVIVAIQIPSVQNIIKDKALVFVESKIGTPISLERIEISFPKKIVVKGLYLESQQGDTLLYTDYLGLDISMLKLLNNTVEVNTIELDGFNANVKRDVDGKFNFDYIIEAFASEDLKEEDSTTWNIALGTIELKQMKLSFLDDYDGHNLSLELNSFKTRIKTFDLEKTSFSIPKVEVDGLIVDYNRKKTKERVEEINEGEDLEKDSTMPIIQLGTILLSDFDVKYKDEVSHLLADLKLGTLDVSIDKIDLENQEVMIDEISLNNTKALATLLRQPLVELPVNIDDSLAVNNNVDWKIGLKKLDLKGLAVQFDNENVTRISKGIDFNHLDFSNIEVELNDFQFDPNFISGNLKHLAVAEQSGLVVDELKGYFLYGEQQAFLKDFYLGTPNTKIQTQAVFNYLNQEQLTKDLGSVSMSVSLNDSHIGIQDILMVMPDLIKQPSIRNFRNSTINATLEVEGLVRDFIIKQAVVSGLGTTRANLNGSIKGMPDFKKAYFDLDIVDLRSSAKDLNALVPPGVIPNTIAIPKTAQLKGTFKGGIDSFQTNLKLHSSSGSVSLVAHLDQRSKNKEKYRIDGVVQGLDLGYILKNDSLGPVSLNLNIVGQSFEPEQIDATIAAHLLSASFNSYEYKDLMVNGTVNKGVYDASIFMKDPNILMDIKASGKLEKEKISLKMDADFQKIDLHGLHIQDKPFAFLGKVKTDLNNVYPDELDGEVQVVDFAFTDGNQVYALDTISLRAVSEPNLKQLILNSQLIDVIVEGDYKLTTLPEELTKSISKYFSLSSTDNVVLEKKAVGKEEKENVKEQQNQEVSFVIIVKENPIVYKMVPDLKELKPFYLDGVYKSATDYFQIHGELASVIYGGNTLRNIVFDLEPKDNRLDYFLDVARFENENLAIDKMALLGTIGNDLLTYDLELKDADDKVRYEISGSLESFDDFMEVKLEPKGFMLNYDVWTVNPENVIQFGKEGIRANAFELTQNNSLIAVQSQEDRFDAPLKVNFRDFDIETITQMVKQDSVLVSGMIDGEVLLKNLNTDMYFESDLLVKDLKVLNTALGDLSAKVNNETTNSLQADIQLLGNDNKLGIHGKVALDEKTIDLNLVVDRLSMKTLESFTMGNLKDSGGYLSGNIALGGGFTAPTVNGKLLFNDVGFKVKALNAAFVDINETIDFTNRGIEFSNFSIADIDKNVLVIDGQILTKTYSDFSFNLDIKSEDFKAIDSEEKDNDLYYGDLLLDTNIKIRGDLNKPIVSGVIGIDKGTDFTFVMPQEDPSIADREGIVEFINQKDLRLEETLKIQNEFNETEVKGLDVSLAIQIDKDAQFTIVIDKANGDKITIKGEGDLMGGIDPSGKTTLTGRYEFEEGAYSMSFNFLKRKFDVQKGSSIIWTGEPTAATLDLTAVYEVNAAPIDLLQNQLSDLSPMQSNMYKQKIPFKTLLMMKGELMKPEITFDIQMPDGNVGVSGDVVSNTKTKLEQIRQQESELNKQVFALLLLNRFVGENPFESMAGGMSAESIARQSVSKILSDQLNNLAGNLIAGVELDFNLDSKEDYSTGEKENRTDLNIGVSKRLLNDRLKVTIGSSFGIEGSERENEQSTNIAGDISAEYMLSKDGRYMLRAYRKDEYQVALQGQVVETGVGFVITMSYEKFKEIFERRKEKRELKELIKEEKKN